MPSKYRVWLVDDREENRRTFEERHRAEWEVRTFDQPDAVLAALKEGRSPNALLCDIYFYNDPQRREEIEKLVERKAVELRELASDLEPDKAQEGIGLIENINANFCGRPKFPVFAYTSKGPYLLHDHAYDRLQTAGAHWLFKNKYSPQNERSVVTRVINEFKAQQLSSQLWRLVVATGLIGAAVGAVLGLLLSHFAHVRWGW